MDLRTALAALGAGIATLLVVAVVVIELLDVEFSAIVGLPVGLLAGLAAFALLTSEYADLGQAPRVAVDAVAGFGFGVVLLLGASYVNLADYAVETTAGAAVAVGALVGIGSWLADRREGAGTIGSSEP